jgi:hypothetical protein
MTTRDHVLDWIFEATDRVLTKHGINTQKGLDMARIRTIKPETPQSESLGRASRDARLLFLLLFTLCDDEGRARGNSRMLASLLFPYDDGDGGHPKTTGADVERWLDELEREDCVVRYSVDGDAFLAVCNWSKHQKIDKPTRSKLPPPPDEFANPREDSLRIREDSSEEGKGMEGKGEERKGEEGIETSDRKAPEAGGLSPDGIVSIWNEVTNGKLPKAKPTPKRESVIRTRLKEKGWADDFRRACAFLAVSEWHQGRNDRGWVATIDFALQAGKATELSEKASGARFRGGGGPSHRAAVDQELKAQLREDEHAITQDHRGGDEDPGSSDTDLDDALLEVRA